MQLLAYRSIYLTILSNQHLTKSVSILSKITQIVYPDKQLRQKKPRCWICNHQYEQTFMLIVHLEIIHGDVVQRYEVKNELLTIVQSNKEFGDRIPIFNKYLIFKGNDTTLRFLKKKHNQRNEQIIGSILKKLDKITLKREQVYFHSTNIFKKMNKQDMDEDSQDQIGEVERQLEKLRIEDFSDVNDNDKKFFIEWNGFIHEKRKKLKIIFPHDIPKIFVDFSSIAEKKGIPRINLVMHAWTLWSVGQIRSQDVIKGLNEYDESKNEQNKTV